MPQLTVTWEKEVVTTPAGLVYRVNTSCRNPVDFPSAAVFLLDRNEVYRNVCSFADFIYYLQQPPVWRLHLLNRADDLDSSYLGRTFTIENTTITGTLRRYNVRRTILCGGGLSVAPPTTGTVIISNGTIELRLPYRGVYEDAAYRSATSIVDFSDPLAANEHVERQRERITTLLSSWKAVAGVFEDTREEQITL